MAGDCETIMPSRREVLRRAGGGFGSLALAALLADRAAAGPAAGPLAPSALTVPTAGPPGDLSFHARRPVAGRHIRSQDPAHP